MEQEQFKEAMGVITGHIKYCINNVNPEDVEDAINKIVDVRNAEGQIFIVGSGRSGSIARTFAIRLSQFPDPAYFKVYFAADISRKVESKDLVLIVSGSGKTASAVHAAEKAKDIGASVLAITSEEKSKLTEYADKSIKLIGGARDKDKGKISSLAPLGTLFECSTMIFLDCMISGIMKKLNVSEKDLQHYNLDDL